MNTCKTVEKDTNLKLFWALFSVSYSHDEVKHVREITQIQMMPECFVSQTSPKLVTVTGVSMTLNSIHSATLYYK